MTGPAGGFPIGRDVPPFYVLEVVRAAGELEASGREVLHLEVGQPSTAAPQAALDAAARAMTHERLGYATANGLAPLRERISRHYAERHRVEVDPGRVVITAGASGGFVLAFLAAFGAGARVAVTEPGYPCYRNTLLAFERVPVAVAVDETTRFQPTPALLDAAGELDGLVVASPSNPTGTALGAAELSALVEWSNARGVRLVADEIYHGIAYGEAPPTALAFADEVIVLNSFSKYFSMTGWRLGWIVAPPALVPTLERLAQNLTVAPPTVSQIAGLAAFAATDELDANVARYARNREILLQGLPRAGLGRFAPPDGAFYLWVEVDHLLGPEIPDSQALCAAWLAELGIAATPGIDFDPVRGSRFVRFSYARSEDDMRQAVDRLVQWSQNH